MKVDSQLLSELGQSSLRSIPEPDDNVVSVPSMLVPVAQIPRAFDIANNTVLTNSGMRFAISRVVNGGDTFATVATLSKGLWRLMFCQNYSSNYASTGATSGDGFLRFTLDSGFTFEWSGFFAAVNPGAQRLNFTMDLNVRGSLLIEHALKANAVGQEHRLYTTLLANMML